MKKVVLNPKKIVYTGSGFQAIINWKIVDKLRRLIHKDLFKN